MNPTLPLPDMLPTLTFAEGAGDVVLNVDGLLDYGLLVVAASTFGKSTLLRLAAEQTYGHVQHLILDVEGEFLNLRSDARPYLILGQGRDVELPTDEGAVRALVLKLVELGQSAIFDLSEADEDVQQRIVGTVCDALARRRTDAPGDVLVFIPELQEFAPESGGKDSALDGVRRLAKRGAKRGARLVADSQRVADVAKSVITQLRNRAIGATDRDDMKRAGEELGLPPRERTHLLALERGVFYVKGPGVARHAILVRVPRPESTAEKRRRGERPAPPAEAPAAIAALAAELAKQAAAAQAEAEPAARTPSGNGASAAPSSAQLVLPDPAALAAEYQRGHEEGLARGYFRAAREERERSADRDARAAAMLDDASRQLMEARLLLTTEVFVYAISSQPEGGR